MNDLKNIAELLNQLPSVDINEIDFSKYFREEFEKFSSIDELMIRLTEDFTYLESTAAEAITQTQSDKFSTKLKDYDWKIEIEQTDKGIEYLGLYLILNSIDKGRIFLPLHILKDYYGNFIYFEATVKYENLQAIKTLTRGTLFSQIKNYFSNSIKAT